jgi:hypothetical protein
VHLLIDKEPSEAQCNNLVKTSNAQLHCFSHKKHAYTLHTIHTPTATQWQRLQLIPGCSSYL